MQVSRKDISPTKVELVVSADAVELAPIKNHALKHFAANVKVPGFRTGTAPAALVEKHIDQRALADEFMEHALNQLYGAAIDQEKLRPASKPQVNVKKFVPFTMLEFEAKMDVIGPIKLPDYRKIKVPKVPVDVTNEDVNGVIKSLQERMAQRKEVTRPAKTGDELVIDFIGKDKGGKPVAGADGKNYPLLLGSGSFIPGFEDKLVGAKVGDKKEFSIKFPDDYRVETLRAKPITFSVNVEKVNEITEPKVDEAFVAKVGPLKTVAELKTDIKKQLRTEKQMQADRQFENELVAAIAEKASVDIPKNLVDEQITAAEEQEKKDLMTRGQSWQEHLDAEGVNEQQHRERQRPSAEQRIKGGLVLSEISEKEDISVSQDEIDVRIQLLKGQYQDPQMQAELDKPENRRDIAARLMTEKTVAKLVEYSNR